MESEYYTSEIDKIELIKKEIRRLYKHYLDAQEFDSGYNMALDTILQYIDSLPVEPVRDDLEEEMIRWHKEHFGNKRDWEKTSGEYLTRKSQLDIAYHFAEWQKQQMMKDTRKEER